MRLKMIDGHETDLKEETLNNFKLKLKGQLLFPDDAGFDDCRSLWNGMINRNPALIVRCIGTADVIASVQFASENNLLICIKGGGHNIAGLAASDGAMLLDMSLMRGVWVDKEKRIARTQAGCLLGDVDRETQLHGLASVLGFVSLTGTAGLTLGGGFGYLTRRWGWTADNLEGIDIVTVDGKLLRASDKENEDLFWGLRGGGGNFGVVTGIDYKLYPVGPEIVGGIVAWPAGDAPAVLDFYRSFSEKAPEELTLVTLIRPAPPAPWIPKEWHGKPIVAILACYSGDPKEGDKVVAPIKAFGNPVADNLIHRSYTQIQSLLDGANPKGRRYYWKSEYISTIDPGLLTEFTKHGAGIISPYSAVILFQLGGALNKFQEDHSPVGNRDASYVLNIASSWDKAEDDEANIGWTKNAWNDMKRFSTGGTYINFLNQDEGSDRTKDALGSSYQRLREIKRKWDPDNFFRTNRNIEPFIEKAELI